MSGPDPRRVPRGAALRPLALIGVAVGAITTFADPDLWGHVRFGLDIIERGHVDAPAVDPYSFTADRRFVYHEWLGGVLMAAAYRVAGPTGLMALKALLALFLFRLVWGAVRSGPFVSRWRWMALAAWGALPLLWSLRPQIGTGIGIVTLCGLLSTQPKGLTWILPLQFAVWANVHGGWIVGGGVLAIWTACEWLRHGAQRRRLLLAGFLSLLATLATPYGIGLWAFLAETVRFGREDIIEWQPIWVVGIVPVSTWIVTVLAIAFSLRIRPRPNPAVLCTLLLLALASARVTRLGPLFVLAAVVLLGGHSARQHAADGSALGEKVVRSPVRAWLDGSAVATAILIGIWLHALPTCVTMQYPGRPDAGAAEALRGVRGRLVSYFGWGEYALWHFGPGLQVSIDGRRETVYSEAVTTAQLAIADGEPIGIRELERIRPEYVWLPTRAEEAATWLRANGYSEDVRTERSFIARRSDLPPLSAWDGRPSGCFPGP